MVSVKCIALRGAGGVEFVPERLGFRVWGLDLRVSGVRSRIWGLWFRVWGSEFRV